MGPEKPKDITETLRRVSEGDAEALGELVESLYEELHTIAASLMEAQPSGHTLQATALVNEAYLKFAQAGLQYDSRGRFLAAAAKAMRWVLADHARGKNRQKRGGQCQRRSLDSVILTIEGIDTNLQWIHEVVEKLERFDPEAAQIVDLRFYAGLSEEDVAEILHISERTVRRKWTHAKAWLKVQLSP